MKIGIAGAGNMAWHLGTLLNHAEKKPAVIINRSEKRGMELAAELKCEYAKDYRRLNELDLLIFALSDSALPTVLEQIPQHETILVHTSGSFPMQVLSTKAGKYGVLYPFQTLTYGVPTNLEKVPVCIEASDPQTEILLRELAQSLSKNVCIMNSEKRKKLHIAGIIANNFSNHLFSLTEDFMKENDLEPALLHPLINETVRKLSQTTAREAQTGPARRKNTEIIEAHKKLLEDSPQLKNLYSLISDSIIAYYSSK